MEAEKNKVILDTNILMGITDINHFFKEFEDFELLITISTIQELDNLKTNRDSRKSFEARRGLRLIRNHKEKFYLVDTENTLMDPLDKSKTDGDILAFAGTIGATVITNDLSMATIGKANKINVAQYESPKDSYRPGYHILDLSKEIQAGENILIHAHGFILSQENDVFVGEYIIIVNHGVPHSILVVTQDGLEPIKDNISICGSKNSNHAKIQGKDPFQICAIDSLERNGITVLTGPAGSGKTLFALMYQLDLLERGEIGKITIFVNPEDTKGAAQLGYYKGDRNTKLLQKSIGGILASKLGEMEQAIEMIESGKIDILPVSDIRGYEVSDNSTLYITEAQNLDVELMKLCLERAGDSVKVIVEGDPTAQLDHWRYEGDNNGMKKLIEVFSEYPDFGHVHLQNVYRSKIAEIAQKMTK